MHLVYAIKRKKSQTISNDFSNILTTSRQSPLKLESDRGKEWYNSIFRNFLKVRSIQHYSRFTDKGLPVVETMIKTVRNLIKKPVFERENADLLSELPSVFKKFKNTIHHSIETTPIQASKKVNEKK